MAEQDSSLDEFIKSRVGEETAKKIKESIFLSSFVRSLHKAMEESSNPQSVGSNAKKYKDRLSLANSEGDFIDRSHSDSSSDGWEQQHMKMFRDAYNQLVLFEEPGNNKCVSTVRKQHATNIAESDSVEDGADRFRGLRRKRKFKRIAANSLTGTNESSSTGSVLKKMKHIPKLKSPDVSKKVYKGNKLPKNNITAAKAIGKRKSFCRERSLECGYHCRKNTSEKHELSSTYSFLYPCGHMECSFNDKSIEFNQSEISSSESECECAATDDSREADDEQSDFVSEPGPSHNVPCSDDDEEYTDVEESDEELYEVCPMTEQRFDLIPAFRGITDKVNKKKRMQLKKKEEKGHIIKSLCKRLAKTRISANSGEDGPSDNNPNNSKPK